MLVSKPEVFGFGLNLQFCSHMVFFASHSFERYYQAVRRCWRFGQTRPVVVDVVAAEGEAGVVENLNRKAAAADLMFAALVREMNDALRVAADTDYPIRPEVPPWLVA